MTLISDLIKLNIELEGVLRVAQERQSPEALELAKKKFAEMAALFERISIHEAEAETDVETEPEIQEEPIPEPEPEPIPMPEELQPTFSYVVNEPQSDEYLNLLLKAFTLNDKFLFRRELFGGSAEDFNDTLNLIAAMASPEEAREYLFDDLGWDGENEIVVDFMAIIDNYFANR